MLSVRELRARGVPRAEVDLDRMKVDALRSTCADALAFVAVYLAGAIWDGEQFRFVVNSVAKDGMFASSTSRSIPPAIRSSWEP